MSPFACLFKTKREREKEQRMLKYGARLLQEIIAACDGNMYYPINIISVNEIRDCRVNDKAYEWPATYEDRRILIKRCSNQDEFFNEITIVVQLNHRNVVKLLGCCFETESPTLIYELVPNNLSDLLHGANPQGPIAWENRLRIAVEIADAVTYMHIAKPRPIIHRDIKSCNILLDEHCRPKLCGFYLSIAIPLGETHVEADVAGTIGYLDPNCFKTSIVTEKVDVYSFGWLLLELLSGRRPREIIRIAEELTTEQVWEKVEITEIEEELATERVLEKVKSLTLIFDANLPIDTRKIEQWMACIELAGRCIDDVPDQRPAMKEVALQLRQIEKHQIPCSSSASSSSS